MLIPDPGSKNSNERQGWKKNLSYLFFGAKNFTKLNYFIFEMLKKKIWANFQRIIELFTQKIVTKLSKIGVWDPGSEIRDPGVKKAPDPGYRIRIRNTVLYDEKKSGFHTCTRSRHNRGRSAGLPRRSSCGGGRWPSCSPPDKWWAAPAIQPFVKGGQLYPKIIWRAVDRESADYLVRDGR